VSKPFGRQELLARVEALLRRARREAPAPAAVQDDGLVRIDHARHAVEVDGRAVNLTPLEFRLLVTFVRHPHHVLSRDQLLDLVWNDAALGTGDQVKLYVSYLRRKLAAATSVAPIETVRGFGYCYRPARSSASSASIAARSS
jgi:DNA-binding response OmpR family regulator